MLWPFDAEFSKPFRNPTTPVRLSFSHKTLTNCNDLHF